MAELCGVTTGELRKPFWVTQPDACGSDEYCRQSCGVSGLKFVDNDEGRTIDTTAYVRGLALNILLTNGRKQDSVCGHKPGSRGGHWSDSFRKDGGTSGSRVRYIPNTYSINETVGLVRAFIAADMQKLVMYGIAVSVDVEVKYAGNNRLACVITINGYGDTSTRVGVSGQRLSNSWVWDSDG